MLQASKSLSKRKREDMEAVKAEKEAKTLRREMRRKGHVVSFLFILRSAAIKTSGVTFLQ